MRSLSMHLPWILICLSAMACAGPQGGGSTGFGQPGAAQEVAASRDADGFTSLVAGRMNAASAGSPAVVTGPLSLKKAGADMSLDRVWSFCVRAPRECDEAVSEYVAVARTVADQPGAAIEKSQLRLALRPAAYLESFRRQVQQSGAQPLARPLVADLFLVVMIDTPRAARVVTSHDLASLGTSEDQAYDLSLGNTMASLRSMSQVTQSLPADGLGIILGEYYESSRLARPEDWADLASRMVGGLIVAAPDPSVVLYGDMGRPNAEGAMRELILQIASKSQRPLSGRILRWTPAGWVDVPQGASASRRTPDA